MKRQIVICNTVELVCLDAEDIICIEADGNYSTIYLRGGEKRFVLFQLGQMERLIGERLTEEAKAFIRIGRSLIINRTYIYYINLNKQQIILRDSNGYQHETLKVSRESLKKLKELIENDSVITNNNEQGTL
jgi:DNA-binding LytR/AlgR family response regulator